MGIVLIAVGLALLISAVRGTLLNVPGATGGQAGPGLLTLFYDDFVGPGNMFVWLLALGLVGAVGYVKPLRPVSDAFLVLIIVVLIVSAKTAAGINFFSSLSSQILATQSVTPSAGNAAGGAGGAATAAAVAPAMPFTFGNYSGTMPITSPTLAPIQLAPVFPGSGIGGISNVQFPGGL